MAKTFYGYAERDADSQLDWSKIGKDFSDMLSKEASDREKMKDKLETETTASLDVMKSTPMGNHEGVNTWALDYSSDAQKQLLMLNRELKAGRLNPKDYTKQRERLTSGTQGLYDVVKGYQTEYEANMKRINSGIAAEFQVEMLESLESMSNFTEYKPIINSATGEVMVGKRLRDKDGNLTAEISDDPNDLASVNILKGRITQKYDKYDVLKNATVLGARYGKYKKVIQQGNIGSVTDKRLFKEFENSLRRDVRAKLSNGFHASSVLADYLDVDPKTGELFYYTADENDKNPNAIHYTYEGNGQQPTFKLSPMQQQIAEEAYVEAVKATLSREETPRVRRTSTKSGPKKYGGGGYSRVDAEELANKIGILLTGTNDEKQNVRDFFHDNKQLMRVTWNPDGSFESVDKSKKLRGGQEITTTGNTKDEFDALVELYGGDRRIADRIWKEKYEGKPIILPTSTWEYETIDTEKQAEAEEKEEEELNTKAEAAVKRDEKVMALALDLDNLKTQREKLKGKGDDTTEIQKKIIAKTTQLNNRKIKVAADYKRSYKRRTGGGNTKQNIKNKIEGNIR
jgi:hypothetical protein